MGITEKEETQKLYYSITEVSEMFELNASTLRFWEKEFDFLRPHKNQHGDRKYTEHDIEIIRTIYHLVEEKGYTLEGVRQKMKNNSDEMEKKMQIIKKLQSIKAFLAELKQELQQP